MFGIFECSRYAKERISKLFNVMMHHMDNIITKVVLVALVALGAASTDLYLSSIPDIVRTFDTSVSNGQLTLSLFMLGFAIGQLIFGPLSDKFGRQPPLRIGLALYVLCSVLCVFADSIYMLLVGRFLQGLTAASGPVLARAIVADRYKKKEAASVMALIVAAMALVPSVAPVIGSWLIYFFEWRVHFIALAVFGVIVLSGCLIKLEETNAAIGESSVRINKILEKFKTCLRNREFIGYLLCGCAIFGAMFAYISSASFIVIEMLGIRPEQFGYTFMIVVFGYISGAFTSSKFVKVESISQIIRLGIILGILGVTGFLIQAVWTVENIFTVMLCAYLCFFSGGLIIANSQMAAISLFPQSAGSASSLFGFIQASIGALAGYIVGYFYNATLFPTALTMLVSISMVMVGYRLISNE